MTTDASNALEDQLESARRSISTDSYPMSIGELTNMYRDGELIINPAYQRLYRWDEHQKSALIESILLGIPIPSIFVAQDQAGRWELVDGLQRVSTILQLQGRLESYDQLTLTGTKYLSKLEGLTWEGETEDARLTDAQKLDIKRAKIDVKIIKRESSEDTKYDLFQRLNSFGSTLSAQEIRNAILVGVNPDFVAWVQALAKHASFVATTRLPDVDLDTKFDEELVLRFLWLHREDNLPKGLANFQVRLEEEALGMARNHGEHKAALQSVFVETFDTLLSRAGEDVFRKWNQARDRFQGGFLNTAFEVIAMGLGYRLGKSLPVREDLDQVAKDLWVQSDMAGGFATGRATERRLAIMLPKGRDLLAP